MRCCRSAGCWSKSGAASTSRALGYPIHQVLIGLMHQEDFHRADAALRFLSSSSADGGRDFARGLQDDGTAVHRERRVKVQPQILGERAIGMQNRIDDLAPGHPRDRSRKRPRRRQTEAQRRVPWARATTIADIFSAATLEYCHASRRATQPVPCRTSCPRWRWARSMAGTPSMLKRVRDGGRGSRKTALGGTGGDQNHSDIAGFDSRAFQALLRRGHGHARDGFAGIRVAPLFNPRDIQDPTRRRNSSARQVRRW